MGAQYTMTNGVNLQLDSQDISLSIYYPGRVPSDKNKQIVGVLEDKSILFAHAEYSEDTFITSALLLNQTLDAWAKTHIITDKTSNSLAASAVANTEIK